MSGIKIPQQDFALKMQGGRGLMCEGGGVFAGHYGIYSFPYRKVCNYLQIAHFLGK